jgi:acetyltransferase-like isoleucine patch superfamily enzyme
MGDSRAARRRRRIRKLRGLTLRVRAAIGGGHVGSGVEVERGLLLRHSLHPGIHIGTHVYLGRGLVLDVPPGGQLRVGPHSKLMHYSVIAAGASVAIGAHSQVAEHCSIRDSDHGLELDRPMWQQLLSTPVTIGDDVWVGRGAAILRGAELGDGCVIGANAVVRGVVPPMAVAVGVPARVVRSRTIAPPLRTQ